MATEHSDEFADATCPRCRARFRRGILKWAGASLRRFPWRDEQRTPYRLAVAEVLLQQTRAENVARLFDDIIALCPTWTVMAEVDQLVLEEALRPLGLQRRRAAVLKALAQAVCAQGSLPRTSTELATLPGIGQYMSRVLALQLHGERVAAIDVNIARVLERVFGPRGLADIRYDPYLQELALQIVPASDPASYTIGLLDFAAAVCRARSPRCPVCPITACAARTKLVESIRPSAARLGTGLERASR